ncbi:AAA family ATPase [Okeanomitos corallinicola TIOX110]|uniref:AAA family ATPase n=1 Tax=Okeanomitos corallinicola TIOX110 TaxID=3133117 RepID=A0ABZ2UXL7_9CYAN
MNQTTLQFIENKNYKNLSLPHPVELDNLNIFIGSNGSGKSNFISCLKFLKDCLTTISDESRGVSSFEDAVSKIGAERILDNSVDSPAVINFSYCFSAIEQNHELKDKNIKLEFNIYVNRKQHILILEREILSDSSGFYFYVFDVNNRNISISDQEGQNHVIEFDSNSNYNRIFKNVSVLGLDVLPLFLESSKLRPYYTPAYKIRRHLIDFISKWQFYNANNMDLNQIRTSEPKIGGRDIYLSASGDNLPLVLDNLIQENIDFEDSINQAMKSILPKTRRLRPIRSGRLSLTVEWYFEDSKEPFYLSEMSDGTVRMLCWATILYSPVLPSLLVIDEPELGLHVSWMPILAEWIKQAARKTQIIITTHSPDLLDHFTDCLENVYCFYSENQTHFSIKRLNQEMLNDKLEEGWELGDLYRVGDPTVGGWPW